MRTNIKGFLSLAFAFTLVVSSCTKDFEEINTNPNGPTEVPPALLIPGIVEVTADQLYSTFYGGDMGSCWAQHWAKVQYNDEERYQPRGSVLDGAWNTFYAGPLTDAKIMNDLALAEGNSNLQGVSKVMTAYVFSILTDTYGDVPYDDALKAGEGVNTPAYTPQSEIYPKLLDLLDEANTLLTADGGEINSGSDILYAGDYLKWKKFANSLKFRILMRMSNRADFDRGADLQALMSRPMFTSNDDEAKLVYLAAAPNNNPVNATILAGNRAEFKVNSALVDKLADDNDPRLAIFAQENADGEYRGKPAGIENVPSDDYNYDNVSPIGSLYLKADAPAYFVSYSELEFLIAEAAQRGLISGGAAAAATHYEAGLVANLQANQVDAVAAGNYVDTHGYNAGAGLSQIAEQKWRALFGQGIEAWTEWRRTGLPALTVAVDPFVATIPTRFSYPPSEQSLNGTAYNAAVAAQGADLLTTKVWWNK